MRVGYNEVIIKYVAEYLRKSRGESIEDLIKHKTLLEELCRRRGWVYIAYEEIETGESLYARPVMQQLLKDIDKKWLRNHIGIVLQDPFLYNKNIYDNVRIASPNKTKEDIYNATKIAHIHNDILNFD